MTRARLFDWSAPLGAAALVLIATLPRVVFSQHFGLIGDEAYYAIWSFHPGFGYYDHSPSVAWVIWLGRMLFGESEFAVRSLFLVSGLLVSALLYRLGTLLSPDRRVAAGAAIAYALTPAVAITFAVATPDGPSTLCWVLAIWAVAEFQASRRPGWWLLAGLFTGLGLLSKYTVVFLGAGFVLFILADAERRRWLSLWQVWVGGALAILLFLPVVIIDGRRGWISFRFQLGRSTLEHPVWGGFYEFNRFLIETAIQLLPSLFVFAVLGIMLLLARRAKPLALPVLTSAPMLGYFLVHAVYGRVNPNWLAPIYPALALTGAYAAFAFHPRSGWWSWPLHAVRFLQLPLGLTITLLALAAIQFRAIPFYGPVPAFDFVYGWGDLQKKVSELAKANGAQWVDAQNYSLNGWLGYYGRIAGDPLPVFQTNEPFRSAYMPPMPDAMQHAPHLYVREVTGPSSLQPPRGHPLARQLGVVTRDEAGEPLARYAVFLVDD